MTKYSLDRFVNIQKLHFNQAKNELLNKRKDTHWMWYIFPQIRGLGKSIMSNYYGIDNLEEAQAYCRKKFLRTNLMSLCEILLSYNESIKIEQVFGITDTKKLQSSMTLFFLATKKIIFKNVLDKFFNGCLDKQTMLLLNI